MSWQSLHLGSKHPRLSDYTGPISWQQPKSASQVFNFSLLTWPLAARVFWIKNSSELHGQFGMEKGSNIMWGVGGLMLIRQVWSRAIRWVDKRCDLICIFWMAN